MTVPIDFTYEYSRHLTKHFCSVRAATAPGWQRSSRAASAKHSNGISIAPPEPFPPGGGCDEPGYDQHLYPYPDEKTMLDQTERRLIVDSFRLVVPIASTAADLFYKRLFEIRPNYRALFAEDMTPQKSKLVAMLAFIVKSLDFADSDWRARVDENSDLFLVVLAMGRRHAELYHVKSEMYGPVGEALLFTLDYGLGKAFTPEVRKAWTKAYGGIASIMRMAKYATISRELKGAGGI
jgi:hemoglobin-like flavoprotein